MWVKRQFIGNSNFYGYKESLFVYLLIVDVVVVVLFKPAKFKLFTEWKKKSEKIAKIPISPVAIHLK